MSKSDIFNSLIKLAENFEWQYRYAKFNRELHQSLLAHSINVASIAYNLLKIIRDGPNQAVQQEFDLFLPKLEEQVILTGFLHDVGKYPEKYQQAVRDYLHQKERNSLEFSHQDKPLVEVFSKILLEELSQITGDQSLASQELLKQIVWSITNLGTKEHAGSISFGFDRPPTEEALLCKELTHLADVITSTRTVEEAVEVASKAAQGKYIGRLKFAYHKVSTIRGILTHILHKAIEEIYIEQGYSPIYWFADGTLYATSKGTAEPPLSHDILKQKVTQKLNELLNNVDPYQLAEASLGELKATVIASPEFLFQNENVIEQFWDYVFMRPFAKDEGQKVDDVDEYLNVLKDKLPNRRLDELRGYVRRFKADYNIFIVLYGVRKALLEKSRNEKELKDKTKEMIKRAFFEELGVSADDWPEVANTNEKKDRVKVLESLISSPHYANRDDWRRILKETLIEITREFKRLWDEKNLGDKDKIVDSLLADVAHPVPADVDYLRSRVEKQYKKFIKGKEKGSVICPLCGGAAESEAQAKLIGSSEIYHDTIAAGSRLTSPNKLWVCSLCEYERKLRILMLGSEQKRAILILPQIGLSRDMGQIWQKYASEEAVGESEASLLKLHDWSKQIWEKGEKAFAEKGPQISEKIKLNALKKFIEKYQDYEDYVSLLVQEVNVGKMDVSDLSEAIEEGRLHLKPNYQKQFLRELRGYISMYYSPNYILFLLKADVSPREEAESVSEIRLLFLRCLLARLFHASVVDEASLGDISRRIGYTPLPRSLALRPLQDRLGAREGWITIEGLGVALHKLSALLLLDQYMHNRDYAYSRDNLIKIIYEEPGKILARISSKESFFIGIEVLRWLEKWNKKEVVVKEVI